MENKKSGFTLRRIQTYNWGTFSDIQDVEIPEKGFLFIGASGSGKSTLLDAHTTMLTAPKYLKFNVAAKPDVKTPDRNLLTYLRGATGSKSTGSKEMQVQYLREDTTWGVVIETYKNSKGETVTIAQILWVRGNSCQLSDVQRRFIVTQKELEVKDFDFFQKSNLDPKSIKENLEDCYVCAEFSAYSSRFCALLGIESELALKLLHKAQSAKNLGDLTSFLREYMLEEPQTFELADNLLGEFDELNAAYTEVLEAKKKMSVLDPLVELNTKKDEELKTVDRLESLQQAIPYFKNKKVSNSIRRQLDQITDTKNELNTTIASMDLQLESLSEQVAELRIRLANDGAADIEQLNKKLAQARQDLQLCQNYRMQAMALAASCAVSFGPSIAEVEKCKKQAAEKIHEQELLLAKNSEKLRVAFVKLENIKNEMSLIESEKEFLSNASSNIPYALQRIRKEMSLSFNMSEEELPFLAELFDVKDNQWRGAAERLLGSVSKIMLVPPELKQKAISFLNGRHLGIRFVIEAIPDTIEAPQTAPAGSIVDKLVFDKSTKAHQWAHTWICRDFSDFICANEKEMSSYRKAITKEGLIKRSNTRFEKDDKSEINDSKNWVIGLSKQAKIAQTEEDLEEKARVKQSVEELIEKLEQEAQSIKQNINALSFLSNLEYAQMDQSALSMTVQSIERDIADAAKEKPDQSALSIRISELQLTAQGLNQKRTEKIKLLGDCEAQIARLSNKIASLNSAIEESSLELLTQEIAQFKSDVNLEEMELDQLEMFFEEFEKKQIKGPIASAKTFLAKLANQMCSIFSMFKTAYPLQAANWGTDIDNLDNYLNYLQTLRSDNLPKFEQKFRDLLNTQGGQYSSKLARQLNTEIQAIEQHLIQINETLATTEFNTGTHLTLETTTLQDQRGILFMDMLKKSSMPVSDSVQMDERFEALCKVVAMLKQAKSDGYRGNKLLDVRQQVDFIAIEKDSQGEQVESYKSGQGKSGGQVQKLTATILAAALRYQLGSLESSPAFCTVALDEAFSNADADFTKQAMGVFDKFGFQMLIANPLKAVQPLEPFIGGALYVSIHNNRSKAVRLEYNEDKEQLMFDEKTA